MFYDGLIFLYCIFSIGFHLFLLQLLYVNLKFDKPCNGILFFLKHIFNKKSSILSIILFIKLYIYIYNILKLKVVKVKIC